MHWAIFNLLWPYQRIIPTEHDRNRDALRSFLRMSKTMLWVNAFMPLVIVGGSHLVRTFQRRTVMAITVAASAVLWMLEWRYIKDRWPFPESMLYSLGLVVVFGGGFYWMYEVWKQVLEKGLAPSKEWFIDKLYNEWAEKRRGDKNRT